MQETMLGARRRGRTRTAWMDNINTWTRLPGVEESIRMTEDSTVINGESTSMVWPTLGSRTAEEQNRGAGAGQRVTSLSIEYAFEMDRVVNIIQSVATE